MAYSCHVDYQLCDPQKIRSNVSILRAIGHVCSLIKAKKFSAPTTVNIEQEGYTCIQILERGHIAIHVTEATNTVYLDVLSFKIYDSDVVAREVAEFFGSQKYSVAGCFPRYVHK